MVERTLIQLKRASFYLSGKVDYHIDITMSVSDELFDWNESEIKSVFFSRKFNSLEKYTDWCTSNFRIERNSDINGCVSQRRYTTNRYSDYDFHIWLDTDIIFNEMTLYYVESGSIGLCENHKHFVLTPEIVKVWDDTWDCLVNENFLDKPLNYHNTDCDPYKDTKIWGNVQLESVRNNIYGQPAMKFAGGWFTCLSNPLLQKIGIPESIGHYGIEDTFIMWGADKLGIDYQFKLKNLVVCEDYKYRNNNHYISSLSVIDRREEYKAIAHRNFNPELQKL